MTTETDDAVSKFICEYVYKVSQTIVSARSISNTNTKNSNQLNVPYSKWFRVKTIDSFKVREWIETNCIGNWDSKHSNFELTICIILSSKQFNKHILLERWKIKFKRKNIYSNNDNSHPSIMHKLMCMQIRSILSYLRLLPTHSIMQSWKEFITQQSVLIHTTNNLNTEINLNPFALYHLIYSNHNKQNNIPQLPKDQNSFSFQPIITKFGTVKISVIYASNMNHEFAELLRCVPGKNPPLMNDNLTEYINSTPKYWETKKESEKICVDSIDDSIPSFHESPLLDTSMNRLDPFEEIEHIRRSTIGSILPLLCIGNVSSCFNNLNIGNNMDDIFGNVEEEKLSGSNDINSESDEEMKDEIFEVYDRNNKDIVQINNFINLCTDCDKIQFKSFENNDGLKDFELVSKCLEKRQQKLITLKKTSLSILMEDHKLKSRRL